MCESPVYASRLALFTIISLCSFVFSLYYWQSFYEYSHEIIKPDDNGLRASVQNGPHTNQPNILLIITDDQGYNDIGYNSFYGIQTPVIDKLANEGLILDNYYVQPICTPTRGQLYSGVHEIHTGLYTVIRPGHRVGLPLNFPTIAGKLKEAGYSTHLVGKWHLGYYTKRHLPTRRGFDSFFGLLNGHSNHFNYTVAQSYDLHEGENNADMAKYKGRYSTHLFAEKAINIINNHHGKNPLFLVVSFTAPHEPLQVPEKYKLMYENLLINTTPEKQTYAGMISCVDEAVGNITEAFKRKGFWNNTVMIYTSDNGATGRMPNSNYPLRGHKGNVFEGGIKVPSFVHSNLMKTNVKGTISKELLHVTDWFPTLAGLGQANINDIKQLYGYDMRDTIFEGKKSPRTEIVHVINPERVQEGEPAYNNTFDSRIKSALRQGDWKLLTNPSEKHEDTLFLFNIKDDPREKHDLSQVHPHIVKKMLDRLEHHRRTAVPPLNYVRDERCRPALHNNFWVPWL
ncbi:hypothetical protein ACF0H5_020667 [Mactra antiquata]